jgi:hypothetical protein
MKDTSSLIVRHGLLTAATALVLGCASTPVGKKELLSVLGHETATRAEVRAQLGEPSASFESSRVIAYRLGENESGYFVVPHANGWDGVRYDLLVEFDAHDIVTAHRLITVRD